MSVPRSSSSRRRSGPLAELIRTLPQRQLIYFWLAVFCTFAMLGFVLDLLAGGRHPGALLALNVFGSGLLAVAYVLAAVRMQRWGVAAVFAAQMAYVFVAPRLFAVHAVAPPGRLLLDAIGTIVTVALGYTCFVRFINVTGARYLRAQAEIALARDIHRVLVPAVDRRIGAFEFLGWSIASGDVGGDLVDLIERDGEWLGYIADVSGHGVGSGVVMGMFKSALRMRAREGGSIAPLLEDVHRVILPLKQPQTFVTVACVRSVSTDRVECAVAGHHPVLRVRHGSVDEVTSPQMAIGMFEDTRFASTVVECQPGDVFALLTDGLFEVFDGDGRELGLDWAKQLLRTQHDQPLSIIADELLKGARRHGTQMDDQSLLLIRRMNRATVAADPR